MTNLPCLRLPCVLLLLVAVLGTAAPARTEPAGGIGLTPEELEWVRTHPVIEVGIDPAWPPFDYLDEDGNHAGIAAEFAGILSATLGLEFRVTRDLTWSEMLAKAEAKELDAIACINRTVERDRYLKFTQAYVSIPLVVVMRDETAFVSSLEDLEMPGVRLTVPKGFASEEWARREHPRLNLVAVPDSEACLRQVASGEVEGCLINLATTSYFVPRLGLTNLKVALNTEFDYDLRMGVPEGNPLLLAVLEKGLQAIPRHERDAIIREWLESVRMESMAAPREAGAVIRIGVLAKRGRQRCLAKWGPTADYLSSEIPGYRFEIVPLGFDEISPAVEAGEVEFILANSAFYVGLEQLYGASAIATLENMRLGGVHTVFGGVIFCRADREDIRRFADLKGKTFMAVEENSFGGWQMAWRELKDHGIDPHRHFEDLRFAGTHDGVVEAVLNGEVDAGTVRTDTLERLEMEGKIRTADFRVLSNERVATGVELPFLHSTRAYPEWPFARARHTSAELADQVSIALLQMDPRCSAARAARCAGWTAPLQYQEVRECLKELRVGPYVDYGKVSLGAAILQHWPWAVGIIAFVVAIGLFAVFVARLNRRLTEGEARIHLLMDSTGEGIFGVDTRGIATLINPAATEELGYSRDEILGRPVHSLIHHSRADGSPYPQEECPMARAFTEGAKSHVEDEVLWRKDGTSFPVEYTSMPIRREGELVGSVVVFRDITERREAEERLHLQSAALNAAANAIVLTAADGTLQWVNPAFTDLTGYSAEEAVGRNPRVLKSGKHPPEFYRDMWETILAGRVWSGELINKRKDGTLYTEEMTITPLRDEEGRITHHIAIKSDISERKRAEEQMLLAREEADRANQAKSEFLSNMSHELRTPLNGVLGYAQILQRDRNVTKQQRETLQAIENCGQHLLTLINDVLDLSKIEAGRMEIEFEPCNLKRLLQSVHDIVRPKAEGKGLSFSLEIDTEVPDGILADATKLKQVLVNLLGNSVKFTEEGGVGLAAGVSEGPRLHLTVSDTGIGMTPEELEEVFDAFKQAKGGKTSGGTGLGLPISRRMAEAMGGSLEVASEPGRGSAFTLTLPVVVVDAEAGEEEAPRLTDNRRHVLAPGQEVSILVVDDGRENRDILVRLLEDAGFRAIEAADGAEALEKLETEEIALTLMDIQMPVMDGIEALKRIRADERLAGHPVVAVSASVIGRRKEDVDKANFDAFVAKPFRVSEVFGVIEKVLGVEYVDEAETKAEAQAGAVSSTEIADAGEAASLPFDLAREIAGRLREATGVGDISAVTALAEELEGRPGVHPALPEEIQGLAMAFDFDGLNGLADRIEQQVEQERA